MSTGIKNINLDMRKHFVLFCERLFLKRQVCHKH